MQKKQPRSARFIAAHILSTLYASRLPVKQLLDKEVTSHDISERNRNLIVQLVYGILRHRLSIDQIITRISTTPLAKIDPFVHQILAVGVYQLFFLDRIPESAAVNEAVNCGRAAGLPKRLQGFINGVLRQTVRNKQSLITTVLSAENPSCNNHPEWLVQRWTQQFGAEKTADICRANNKEPDLVLRVNSSRITPTAYQQLLHDHALAFQPGRFHDAAIILPTYHGSISAIPGFNEGFFQVQDEAAQLATILMQPFVPGGKYLDGCAGLGGKTTHLLEFAVASQCRVTAIEPEPFRTQKLTENVNRLFDDPPITIIENDLLAISPENSPLFDGILIDAPCSGTGVTGRHPDIRWNRRPEDLAKYQHMQFRLARHAATLLKPGGVMIYATCSLEREENEEVIALLCETMPQLEITDCGDHLPATAQALANEKFFQSHPGTLDGFFAARLTLRQSA